MINQLNNFYTYICIYIKYLEQYIFHFDVSYVSFFELKRAKNLYIFFIINSQLLFFFYFFVHVKLNLFFSRNEH